MATETALPKHAANFGEEEVTLNGVTLKVKEWAKKRGIRLITVYRARQYDMKSWEEALTKRKPGSVWRKEMTATYRSTGKPDVVPRPKSE